MPETNIDQILAAIDAEIELALALGNEEEARELACERDMAYRQVAIAYDYLY